MTCQYCFAFRAIVTLVVTLGWTSLRAEEAGFNKEITPFLKQHCHKCHNSEKPKAKLRLDTLRGKFTGSDSEEAIWSSVLERVSSGDMPPKGEPPPDPKTRDSFLDGVRNELRKIGKDPSADFAYPSKGNYLDHKLLFGTPSNAKPATSSRIWRISPFQYAELMKRWIPPELYRKLAMPVSLTSDQGFRDYAFRYSVGAAENQQMLLNAGELLTRMMREDQRKFPELVGLGRQKEPATAPQIEKAVNWTFGGLVRRPPTEDELRRYAGILTKSIEKFGNKEGTIQGLSPIFIHPEVIYRLERGGGAKDEYGRVMLTSRELAFAIALALTDKPPDESLLKAVEDGRLSSRADARDHVARLLNDPNLDRPRILRFFQEYFGYYRAPDIFKDRQLISNFNVPSLVEDTDQMVLHILKKDRDVLKELLTTNESFVHYSTSKAFPKALEFFAKKFPDKDLRLEANYYWLGKYYNLTPREWSHEQPLKLPADQRAGILTQPSWLYTFATNVETHPIHRGEWVYKYLLGGTIPDVPITVDARFPDEPHNTMRERLRFTREAYCWNCHQRMNPMGLPFEAYDLFGQHRSHEVVLRPKPGTKNVEKVPLPVDTSGELRECPDPSLNAPVKDTIEMLHRLGKSEHVQQVFVRHAFRYWMGRNETLDDAPTLQAAHRAYKESNGSMNALIVSLLTSDSFLYRRPTGR